jgi:hypothetical protein
MQTQHADKKGGKLATRNCGIGPGRTSTPPTHKGHRDTQRHRDAKRHRATKRQRDTTDKDTQAHKATSKQRNKDTEPHRQRTTTTEQRHRDTRAQRRRNAKAKNHHRTKTQRHRDTETQTKRHSSNKGTKRTHELFIRGGRLGNCATFKRALQQAGLATKAQRHKGTETQGHRSTEAHRQPNTKPKPQETQPPKQTNKQTHTNKQANTQAKSKANGWIADELQPRAVNMRTNQRKSTKMSLFVAKLMHRARHTKTKRHRDNTTQQHKARAKP